MSRVETVEPEEWSNSSSPALTPATEMSDQQIVGQPDEDFPSLSGNSGRLEQAGERTRDESWRQDNGYPPPDSYE
jgi:hypothetical protein